MSYIFCYKCKWSQDDFWSKEYNPLKSLLNWEETLLSDKFNDLLNTEEGETYTFQEAIARSCESVARVIRNMKYRTKEELKRENSEFKCPSCGAKLGED